MQTCIVLNKSGLMLLFCIVICHSPSTLLVRPKVQIRFRKHTTSRLIRSSKCRKKYSEKGSPQLIFMSATANYSRSLDLSPLKKPGDLEDEDFVLIRDVDDTEGYSLKTGR